MKSHLVLLLCLLGTMLHAQNPIPIPDDPNKGGYYGPQKIIVKFDPVTNIPVGNLPFDRDFIARFYFLNQTDVPIRVHLVKHRQGYIKSEQLGFYDIVAGGGGTPKTSDYDGNDATFKYFPFGIDVHIPPLQPNTKYEIVFVSMQKPIQFQEYLAVFDLLYHNKTNEAKSRHKAFRKSNVNPNTPTFSELQLYYSQQFAAIDAAFKAAQGNVNLASSTLITLLQTTDYITLANGSQRKIFLNLIPVGHFSTQQYNVQTRAGLNVIADGGLIYTGFQPGFKPVVPYVGINISLRPMDSDIPFPFLLKHHQINFFNRLTVNVGLTLNSLAKANYRDNLFGNYNVMTGLGFKLSHVFNINGGILFYNNLDGNPVNPKKTVGAAPYVGLSINLKIKDALGDVAKLFSYGK